MMFINDFYFDFYFLSDEEDISTSEENVTEENTSSENTTSEENVTEENTSSENITSEENVTEENTSSEEDTIQFVEVVSLPDEFTEDLFSRVDTVSDLLSFCSFMLFSSLVLTAAVSWLRSNR